jgi:hypothetical protein
MRLLIRKLTRISQVNGEMWWGVKGMLPLGCLPLWGSEGVTLVFSGKNLSPKPKNQMNFSIQTVIKTTPFFCPVFLNRPHSEKPLRA